MADTSIPEGRWQDGAAPIRYPDPDIKVLDPRFRNTCWPMAAIERIAGGCRFTEGPVWFGDGRYLLWSDIPNDRIMKWEEETGAISVWRRPSQYANGNTRDREGRLVTCEMGSQRLTRTEYDGTITVLAERFDGKRLTGPNDVVVKSDGSIWFSDNGAGIRGNYLGNKGEPELPFRVYRLDPRSGEITIVVDRQHSSAPTGWRFRPTRAGFTSSIPPAATRRPMSTMWSTMAPGSRTAASSSTRCRATPTASGSIPTAMSGAGSRAARARTASRCSHRTAICRPHPLARALRQCCFGGESATACSWPRASRSIRYTSRRREYWADKSNRNRVIHKKELMCIQPCSAARHSFDRSITDEIAFGSNRGGCCRGRDAGAAGRRRPALRIKAQYLAVLERELVVSRLPPQPGRGPP